MRALTTCLLLIGLLATSARARTWSDTDGKRTVDAEYVGVERGQVKLRFTRTGKVVFVPLGALSEEDQEFVRELVARSESDIENANGSPDRFTMAIRDDPTNPLHYVARGRARTNKGDFGGAIKDFTKAIELAPQDPTTYNARGIAYQRNSELIAAQQDFDKAIELDPQYASAYRNRGENLRKMALDDGQRAPELDAAVERWQRFWNHARRDNLRRAPWQPVHATKGDVSRQAALCQMAKIDKQFADRLERDHDQRGNHQTGHTGDASHGPGHACPACSDASCPRCGCPVCGGGKPAPGSGAEASTSNAVDAIRVKDLAEECVEEQDYDRAVAAYDWLLKDEPDNLVYLRDRAATHLLRGGYDYAVRDYDYLLSLRDRPDATLYYNRGCAHLAAGRMQEALSDFSKAITLNEDWSLAFNNRGATYARLGQYAEAIKDFTRAIESDPRNRLAYRNRASAYRKLGQPSKAEADFAVFQELANDGDRQCP